MSDLTEQRPPEVYRVYSGQLRPSKYIVEGEEVSEDEYYAANTNRLDWLQWRRDEIFDEYNDLEENPRPIRIFVYGTLMEGRVNHRRLRSPDIKFVGNATLIDEGYTMISAEGRYPGVIRADEGQPTFVIRGEVYEVNSLYDLKLLDRMEAIPTIYDRVSCTVQYDDGEEEEVEFYEYCRRYSERGRTTHEAAEDADEIQVERTAENGLGLYWCP